MSDFFQRYHQKTQRTLCILLSREIDNNVKNKITNANVIVEKFIKEIKNKEMDSWIKLRSFTDKKSFYDECLRYCDHKIPEYKDRYKQREKIEKDSEKQVKYLSYLIESAFKSPNYLVRKEGYKELINIIETLSKSSRSEFIDIFKEILENSNKSQIKENQQNNIEKQ